MVDVTVRSQRNLEARAERALRAQRFGIAVDDPRGVRR